MADKHTPKRLYVGTMNDAFFIIDRKPRPAPVDYLLPGGDTNVIAKMANNDREAEAEAARIVKAANRDHLFGELVTALGEAETWLMRVSSELLDGEGSRPAYAATCEHVRAVLAKAKDEADG